MAIGPPLGRKPLEMSRKFAASAVFCLLAFAGSAHAGAVYRCESEDGQRSYSSRRVPGASCTVVGQFSRSAKRSVGVATRLTSPAPLATSAGPALVNAPATPVAPVAVPAAATRSYAPSSAGASAGRRISGRVYSYRKNGILYVTSAAPRGDVGAVRSIPYTYIESCFACGERPKVNFGSVRLNTVAYSQEITNAARQHGVEEAFVRAIIHAESAYNPRAVSRVGAQGLMQLMPATARRFGVNDAFDAGQNINGGVQYLAWLLRRFNGDIGLAAAGYNAGEGAVDKYRGVPPYSETRHYVERVRQLADRYRTTLR